MQPRRPLCSFLSSWNSLPYPLHNCGNGVPQKDKLTHVGGFFIIIIIVFVFDETGEEIAFVFFSSQLTKHDIQLSGSANNFTSHVRD